MPAIITKTKTSYPVATADIKAQARVEAAFTDDDTYITTLGKAVTLEAEGYINASIALTSNVYTDNNDGDGGVSWGVKDEILIDEANVYLSSGDIVSIKIDGGTALVLDTDYEVIRYNDYYFVIRFLTAQSGDEIVITFNTGFDATNKIPEDIQHAILMKCAYYYAVDRTGYVMGNQKATERFNALLNKHIASW